MALSRLYYTRAEVALDNETTATLLYQSYVYAMFGLATGVKVGGTTGTSGAPPAGVLWTIDQMCDGVAVTGAGVNSWGATFDASKLVLSAFGASPKSWVVLKSPTTLTALGVPFYLTIGMQGTANGAVAIGLSKTQPSGGTVNVIPTATDTVAGGSVSGLLHADLTIFPAVHKAAIVFGANGSFWFSLERTGQAKAHTFFAIWDFSGPESTGDLFPVGWTWATLTTGRGVPGVNDVLGAGGWSTSYQTQSGGFATRSRDNAANPGSQQGMGILVPGNSGWLTSVGLNHAGKSEPIECVTYFVNNTSALSYNKGVATDWWIANSAKAVGLVDPPTGASELILLGNIWLPNGGVPHVL